VRKGYRKTVKLERRDKSNKRQPSRHGSMGRSCSFPSPRRRVAPSLPVSPDANQMGPASAGQVPPKLLLLLLLLPPQQLLLQLLLLRLLAEVASRAPGRFWRLGSTAVPPGNLHDALRLALASAMLHRATCTTLWSPTTVSASAATDHRVVDSLSQLPW